MYKVFVNKREIIITCQPPANYENNSLIAEASDEEGFKKILEDFLSEGEDGNLKKLYIISGDIEKTWSYFKNSVIFIEAAGGIVLNPQNQILFIYRHGKWDLPKGKKEPNESPKNAALREVIEECGISYVELIKPLSPTHHMYQLSSQKWVLKTTYWYLMYSDGWRNPIPQLEEDISKVIWTKESHVYDYISNTYPSIRDLVEEYLENKC